MTYNLSPKAVERWRKELDRLLDGEEITFQSDAPHKLAYRLREAIAAAKRNKIEPWASLEYQFRQEAGCVIATPRDQLVKGAELVEKSYTEAVNEFDVIGIATKDPGHVMIFPSFSGDLEAVQSWANAKGYHLTEDPLTLRRRV